MERKRNKGEKSEDEGGGAAGCLTLRVGGAVAVTTCGHVGIVRVLRLPDWQNAMKYTCPILLIVSCTIDTMAP